MNIERYFINCNYSYNEKRDIKYIVVHYTAGTTSKKGSALNTVKNVFNKPGANASAHYVVDNISIVQCVEDKDTAWHCGTNGTYYHKYCRNSNSIGIELCSNHDNFVSYEKNTARDKGWYFNPDTLNNGIKLIKYLSKKYNIPKENVLMHYDVTGKICPAPFINNGGWDNFIERIFTEDKEERDDIMVYNKIEEVPEYAREIIKKYVNLGFIKGTDKGLELTDEMIRIMVIIDRIIGGV